MRSQYRVPPDVDRGYLPFRQADEQPWNPAPSRLARLSRRLLPVTPSR
jgi:hypothetical protein